MKHIPVLLEETVSALDINPDSVVVDCTLGGGGHAKRIIDTLGPDGIYIGIDADPLAVTSLEHLKESRATVHLINDNFANLKQILDSLQVSPTAVMADLGWRSDQFDGGSKGFSFAKDEPLLMTFGDPEKHVFTAYDIVNEWEESSIVDILRGWGEERFAGRIASSMVKARQEKPIETSLQLANIVSEATPGFYRHGRIHPATRTFQALRIAVNDEIGVLHTLLQDGFEALSSNGRLAIISFHSLEDRPVKKFFNQKIKAQEAKSITKKPIVASEEEIRANPRSRSAKLRVIEKI